MVRRLLFLSLFCLFLAACKTAPTPTPTATTVAIVPTATATPTVTATSSALSAGVLPTNTTLPTVTPSPTRTPRPTATPVVKNTVETFIPATAVAPPQTSPTNRPLPTQTANLTASLIQSGNRITGIVLNQRTELTTTLRSLTVEPAIVGEWQIEWQDNRTILSLEPASQLPGDTMYSFAFTEDLFAADGRLLHTPAPFTHTTPTMILDVFPKPDNGWWPARHNPITDITITFRGAMDQSSVEKAFQINPPVAGEFAWQGNQLTFYPGRGYLNGDSGYTVTLQPTARDAEGNPILSQAYSWSFTTGELYTEADFGVGYKMQVVDADARRAVQYRSYETRPLTVTFSLHDVNQEQVVQSFANFPYHNYRFDLNNNPAVITWTAVTSPTAMADESYGYYHNPQEVILPASIPPGPYVLTVEAGEYQDHLLILLSQNTLAIKRAGAQITAWATNINGAVRPDLEMSVWDDKGREVANGRTDGMGVFQTTLPPGSTPAFVLARSGDDLVISGFDHHYGQYRHFTPPPAYLAHITTDRPIYRPGHTVYFKAILRANNDATMSPLPEGTAVTVNLRDARNNLVETLVPITNHFGTVYGQFQLAEGAMLGNYKVEISLPDGGAVSQLFKVEDYRKPDYEVTVTTDANRYLVGDTVSVTVDSRYFFGEPVVDAAVQVYVFSRNWGEWSTWEAPLTGQTDGHGRYTFTLTPGGGNFAIEATVDDGSHQSVSGFHNITVHSQAENLWLNTGMYRKEPGTPVTVQVNVVDIFGKPVANRAVNLQLRHYSPDSGRYADVERFSGATDENGRYTLSFTPAELGYYQLAASATDRLGNALSTSRHFMVYNPADRSNRWYGRSDALTITDSQESYVPGETGQLFIQSSFAGPALLTLERATVLRQQLIELTPPLTVVDIPITAADTPNLYANVMAWQPQDTAVLGLNSLADSRILFAETQLAISLAPKTLQVAISPDKTQYGPGEETTVTLRVTNSLGHPVSAELSLAVVDEAIFSLSPELVGPMLDRFYFRRPNQVTLFNSMHPSRRLWYAGEEGGMGGGGGGEDNTPLSGQPRRDFQDTAAWFPVLHTDANGEVTVTFTLPDNLTSWRFTARAVTADTQVGETTHNITTWKPVIVRPILPRALTAGDELELSAVIHNNSETAQMVNVQLSIANLQLTIDHSSFHTITVPPGASQVVGWPVTAVAAGTITLTVQAGNASGVLDSVELPLTIRPLAVPDVSVQVGQFTDSFTTNIVWPEDALPLSTLSLDLNRSIAGSMVNGLEYLTGYPYGCVEQTMSRALPNAVVARAFRQLGVSNPALLNNLEPLVQASVQRLYSFQHDDGGWGWWTDDSSHDYQTAWVIFGLATTADAGYAVDPAVIARGATWLRVHLPDMDVRTRAFALYALALSGHGNLRLTQAQAMRPAGLDTFSRAALALALHELGDAATARQLVDDLAQTATVNNGIVYWPGEVQDGYYDRKTMASTTRNSALALSAFAQIRPGHELEAGIVRYLMNEPQTDGWGSTNETAFAILALTDHLLAAQQVEGTAVTAYTVYLNGQTVVTGTLAPDTLTTRVEIPGTALASGNNELVIEHEGLLYYVINSRVYQPQTTIEATGSVGVTRLYLDGVTGQPITAVTPNQIIQVKITVNMPTDATYIIVEDRLPGGLEALNERLDTTTLLTSQDNRPYWQRLGYNYKEVYGDRVSFFITDMAAGSHIFTYYARATHVGEFVALPAEVYAMYDMSVWGRSASRPLVIQSE